MKMNYARNHFSILIITIILIFGCAVLNAAAAQGQDAEKKATQASEVSKEPTVKTIGIIGGVSWASSIEYYRLMNEIVRDTLGGVHSAQILMFSIEFGEFSKQERLADKGDWTMINQTMEDAALRLKRGGADFVVIASNTLNSLADRLEKKAGIPFLNIADATGEKVREKGLRKVALLGTKFTMEQPFYRNRLKKYGLTVVAPNEKERDYINRVIFDELCANRVKEESKREFVRIINRLKKDAGVEGVILGCTEIPMLIKQADVDIPVFDTTVIHSEAAVKRSLGR
jgi:aspartate racemase